MSKYYVRWAFPKRAKAPTMFIKELNATRACSKSSSASLLAKPLLNSAAASSSDQATAKEKQHRGSGLMRSEDRPSVLPLQVLQDEGLDQQRSAPRQVKLDEIRFPQW